MVGWVERFRDRLGLPLVDLVGHSLGGQVAVHYAYRFPDRVQRLVLIDPDGLAGEEGAWLGLTRLGSLVDLAFELNTRFFIELALRANVFHGTEGLEEVTDGKAGYLLTPEGNRAVARITREAVGTEPVNDMLPLVSQETLVLWGEKDRLLPIRWAEEWIRLLPRARLCTIVECGHMPCAEKPAETAACLEAFLAGP
jgi:pimeloyl-ACP methyl ester carboxylesterase